MEEGNEKLGESEKIERDDIYSKVIKAGKRTYFFDVKATRQNDLYLIITESRKRFNRDGRYFFEKHKVFLYREEFARFLEGLTDTMDFIRQNQGEFTPYEDYEHEEDYNNDRLPGNFNAELEEVQVESFSNLEFDDLDEKR